MGKKNAAMVDREDKSTQTTEIFVGKISGRKHGIVGNVSDKRFFSTSSSNILGNPP